jgi:hypothetical protein
MHLSILFLGVRVQAMGGDLTKNWVKCILRFSNVTKQTHPGDRSRQNILITFKVEVKFVCKQMVCLHFELLYFLKI